MSKNKILDRASQEVIIEELAELCKPITKYLRESHTPYCNIIISYDQIRVTEDILGIPIKSND